MARARDVTCESEAVRRGLKLRRAGAELIGPCPVCGGTDRFAINRIKNTFLCRRGGVGGDAIAMVEYLDAVGFLDACARLTGEPIPDGDAAGPDEAELARREAARREQAIQRELEATTFREKARRDAFNLWRRGRPAEGTAVEAYLAARGLPLPAGIRMLPAHPYWHEPKGGNRIQLHEGPAMLAAVQRPDGRFGAVHVTWIDPDRPGRKMALSCPATGESLPAKKVRGHKKGGAIRLITPAGAIRLVIGEGIETTASAAVAEERLDTAYWVAVDLGNLGGRAAGTVRHPTEKKIDVRGRARSVFYAGPDPDMADDEAFVPPPAFAEVIYLGDGDSERLATEAALTRGARRAMRLNAGQVAKIAWAPPGADFNDVLCGVGQ